MSMQQLLCQMDNKYELFIVHIVAALHCQSVQENDVLKTQDSNSKPFGCMQRDPEGLPVVPLEGRSLYF